MMNQSTLERSSNNAFELNNKPLVSGTALDIQINGVWLSGMIELCGEDYCWFSGQESIPVILKNGIIARVPDKRD